MSYINKFKSFISPYFKYKKNYWLAKSESVNLPSGNKIFIFLAANYGNLGDIAITYAQYKLLEKMENSYSVVEIPANCSYSYLKGVVRQITQNDIVTFVGGGNMGDMYPLYENIRQIVVSELPNVKVIQFPLTADFSNSVDGQLMLKSAKKIYGKQQNLTILARERKTSIFLSKILGIDIPIVPDVVLTLDYFQGLQGRKGIAVCLRSDKEKSLTTFEVTNLKDVVRLHDENFTEIDTVVDDNLITLENKTLFLEKFLTSISRKRLIVTDRLHGMIFAYITGTPAIVFSNSNHKVKECYEWIKDSGYIYYMDNYDQEQFENNIIRAYQVLPDRASFEDRRKTFVGQILNAL